MVYSEYTIAVLSVSGCYTFLVPFFQILYVDVFFNTFLVTFFSMTFTGNS